MTLYFGNTKTNGHATVTNFHLSHINTTFKELQYNAPSYITTSQYQTTIIHGSFFTIPQIVQEAKQQNPHSKVWAFVINESLQLPRIWTENLKHADGLLYVSSWNYQQYHPNFPGKPGYVIHSWITSPELPIGKLKTPFADYKYRFYTISTFNPRKNLDFLIRGFLDVFAYSEEAALFVKAGFDFPEEHAIRREVLLKLLHDYDPYPNVFFEWKYQSDEWIDNLHHTGNIYVNTSLGEATCLPLLQVPLENSIIAPKEGGHCDYISDFHRIQTKPGKVEFTPLFREKMFWYYPEEVEWNIPQNDSYHEILCEIRDGKHTFGHIKHPITDVTAEWDQIFTQ